MKRAALVLAMLVATPAIAASSPISLLLEAPTTTVRVGEAVVLHALARDAGGAPVEGLVVSLGSRQAVTNSQGAAFFHARESSEGARSFTLTSPGLAPASANLTWVAPRAVVQFPSNALVGQSARVDVRLVWGANFTPVENVSVALETGDTLVWFGQTLANGSASLIARSASAGVKTYRVVVDDPLLRADSPWVGLVWSEPLAPPPPPPATTPPPTPPAPAPAPERRPPTVGASIRIVGGLLIAEPLDVADPEGGPVFLSYSWNVDGVPSFGPSVPARAGSTARLTILAVDADGLSAFAAAQIVVPANAPPVARATASGAALVGTSIVFDAGASTDGEGSALSFVWTFSDGAVAHGARVEHAFAASGPASARVRVTDADGAAAEGVVDLFVHARQQATSPEFSVERVLNGSAILVRTEAGLAIADPTGAHSVPASVGDGLVVRVGYVPLAMKSSVEAEPLATQRGLVRVMDPQPGLATLGVYAKDGSALTWWKEGDRFFVVTDETEFEIVHAMPPLDVVLETTSTPAGVRLEARATGGAPLEEIRIETLDGQVIGRANSSVLVVVLPTSLDARDVRVVARSIAGESASRQETILGADSDPATIEATALLAPTRDRALVRWAWSLLVIFAIAGTFWFIVLWRRRRKDDEER